MELKTKAMHKFQKLKYLSDLPEGYDWVAKQIKREAKNKNKKLFKIKQALLPKTMTA